MKKTNRSQVGTSYHGDSIDIKPENLIKLAEHLETTGCVENTGVEKINFDFTFETDQGDVFTVYDYKYYRPLKLDKVYNFHIGGFHNHVTRRAKIELENLLNKLKLN